MHFGTSAALLLVAVGIIAVPVQCFTTTVPSVLPHNAPRCNPSFARPARPRELQNCGRVGMRAFEQGANGVDPAYPYLFDGRLWFRPAIVRVSQQLPDSIRPISLFGFSIGGVVSLEYDASPVGPYREYVTMGSVVTKRGALGQWGSRLFVSTQTAEEVCRRVWGVPAETACIEFIEEGPSLRVEAAPQLEKMPSAPSPTISVTGWARTRTSDAAGVRRGGLPVYWTPSIKALWAPVIPFAALPGAPELPLHELRLSASSMRLHFCAQSPNDLLGLPLPVGLSVDGLRIEISPKLLEKAL